MEKLYWNTVNISLRKILQDTMETSIFDQFRLVGGTALSLQLGHRISVDIDLFTDAPYNSIDFNKIDQFFKDRYSYVDCGKGLAAIGRTYYAGASKEDAVKVDVYYDEPFIRPLLEKDNTRLAGIEDINAMKLEVISGGGRKKDFWDVHELINYHQLTKMMELHKERYPYSHDEEKIRVQLTDFTKADDDFVPNCLKGKHWEIIKLELHEWLQLHAQ